ncbi:MAG: ZIP family metal transporter [Clostridia bacterium]|nr:ZIP family metal transporter [Clostridia bacterium]
MSNVQMTVFGIGFIFVMTTIGAAIVFFFRKTISFKVNSLFLGFSSGIMVAASIWSLLLPAIDASEQYGIWCFIPATIGLLLGGVFLMLLDKSVIKLNNSIKLKEETKHPDSLIPFDFKKNIKLFLAVTLHNIPEGLAVGFAFGTAATLGEAAAFIPAMGLAIGIGIQNFPEGAAVSIPMRSVNMSRSKAFLYGMGSGAVEPVFAVIGYFLATYIAVLQPWLLAFAAGAMLFVVAEDLIPDAKHSEHPHLSTWGFMLGFVVMMILDVALG